MGKPGRGRGNQEEGGGTGREGGGRGNQERGGETRKREKEQVYRGGGEGENRKGELKPGRREGGQVERWETGMKD